MQQITLRLSADMIESLEGEADERGVSRSEHLRDVIDSRHEHEAEVDELREEVDELQTEVERLRNEKQLVLEEREEKQKLARYVEEERRVEQQWREAGLATRMKWRLLGMPSDGVDA